MILPVRITFKPLLTCKRAVCVAVGGPCNRRGGLRYSGKEGNYEIV